MEVLTSLVSNIGIFSAVCFIAGLALVVVEMFVPGWGFPGISGCILLLLGVIFTANSIIEAFVLIIIILAILGVCLSLIIHSAKKGKLPKNVILSTSMDKENSYISEEDMEYFLGKEGVVITTLRPVGSVDFDGVKLDVSAEGQFIEKGTNVKVVKVEGKRIVVRKSELV